MHISGQDDEDDPQASDTEGGGRADEAPPST